MLKITRKTLTVWYESSPGRVVTYFGDQNWPPRPSELTPMDFFLRDFLKSEGYANKRITTHTSKAKIEGCTNEISRHIFKSVIENLARKVLVCHQSISTGSFISYLISECLPCTKNNV